jgi:hypothetical protein
MKEHKPTYSEIIAPEDYNRIITDEHLYIAASDRVIRNFIEEERDNGATEVVEVGFGPARIIEQMGAIDGIHLTGVDHDPQFHAYARKIIKNTRIRLVLTEVADYQHEKPVDVFYSQGTHHHILKGKATDAYLRNIYNQLKAGGAYIIGDEFLPEYTDEDDRHLKAVIWYSHIIANGKRQGYGYLAQEEAKTLLDDLNEGTGDEGVKSPEQIALVLNSVEAINDAAMHDDLPQAHQLASAFLTALRAAGPAVKQNDPTMDLSRGDYKICESALKKEVEPFGFVVEKSKAVGPIDRVGAMVVYKLRKPAQK